jgi:histidine triad (HIT) family protein
MSQCIFCKISAGLVQAQVVFESSTVMAFRDVNPQVPSHILIIPKKHVQSISALSEQDGPVLLDVHKAVLALAASEPDAKNGFRLVTNDGVDSGQTVPHLHFHFLAGRKLSWPPG